MDTDILSNDLFVRDPEIMTAYGLLKQHYYTTLSPMSFKMAFAVADIYRELPREKAMFRTHSLITAKLHCEGAGHAMSRSNGTLCDSC